MPVTTPNMIDITARTVRRADEDKFLEPPLVASLNSLQETYHSLCSTVTILKQRLEPVLSDTDDISEAPKSAPHLYTHPSPLVRHIEDLQVQMGTLNQAIREEILARLAL